MKVINIILLVLAVAGVVFCGVMGVQYMNFPAEAYAQELAAIRAETVQTQERTRQLEADLAQREAELADDLNKAGADGAALAGELARLEAKKQETADALAEAQARVDKMANIYENTLALRDEYAGKIRQLEDMINAGETDVKICYWTFDDGPSYHTQEVLDICRQYGAYVTFFTSREANSSARDDDPEVERGLLRGAAMGGHSVQNHTNSHQYAQYGNVYGKGLDSFREQVEIQDQWIYECTGIKADIFRFPGGSAWAFAHLSKDGMLSALEELGYVWVDWSCDIFDNSHANPDVATEVGNALYEIRTLKIAMILSHDWNGNTIAAFQRVLPQLQKEGYIFLPLFSQSWTIGNTRILFS